jgi:hypothetical protein
MRYYYDCGVESPDPTPATYKSGCRVRPPVSTVLVALLFMLAAPALAERYEYSAEVNRPIPDFDSVGVTDTIFVPIHAIIEDINFYVGIGTIPEPWAEDVYVDVYSPYSGMVRLNGHAPPYNMSFIPAIFHIRKCFRRIK